MPVIINSTYKKPIFLPGRHIETMLPSIFRKPPRPLYIRERINTRDGDFLDLDWAINKSENLVILSHGLEGDSGRPYMVGMSNIFTENGWDVCAWNYRGCSGKVNLTHKSYHSGATKDLALVTGHAIKKKYSKIALIGFSLGANLTLKYIGESTTKNYKKIKAAVVFSAPIDLAGCSKELGKPNNKIYTWFFIKSLINKIKKKRLVMPDFLGSIDYHKIKSIYEFDDKITGPLHGFDGADHYYQSCSALNFIRDIKIPTLVVNALNDPFLSQSCFENSYFVKSKHVFFETPKHGGHVGFSNYNKSGRFWSEHRAWEFISSNM